MSIVDLFFYEELSSIAGHDVGTQWLKNTSGDGAKHGKSSLRNTGKSRSPHTSSWTLDRDEKLQNENVLSSVAKCRESLQLKSSIRLPKIHVDSLPNLYVQSYLPQDLIKAANLSPKLKNPTNTDDSKLGLMFTDAAHTVLD